jgi:hypothetical protein
MNHELYENPVELRTGVPAPHFNDRRVVMRAQRVVPLNEIRRKLRLRRLWFFSSAFAIAMMLGATSALVAVRVKRMAATNEIPQVEQSQTAVTAEAQALPADDEIPESVAVEEPPVLQPVRSTAAPKRPEPSARRPRIVGTIREDRDAVQPSEDEQLEQIRDAVLYEQWQERRLRRAARRDRRNRASERDLSHVDEIFEGPRRPERP